MIFLLSHLRNIYSIYSVGLIYDSIVVTMEKLSLLPLPVIFFPGFPVQLNIFEESHKKMIRDCVKAEKEFGFVLLRSQKRAASSFVEAHDIGTIAHITRAEEQSEGHIFLEVLCLQRFAIHSLDYQKSYLQGYVELECDEWAKLHEGASEESRELLQLLTDYCALLRGKDRESVCLPPLPQDPRFLAYFGAYLLQVPETHKQKFLEIEKTEELISNVVESYRYQICLLRVLQSIEGAEYAPLN